MPRITVNTTDDFEKIIKTFMKKKDISKSQALLQLAAIGAASLGYEVSAFKNQWGGSRDKARPLTELDLDRLEVSMRGLPPMADDD